MAINSILNWYWNESERAIEKHGFENTPAGSKLSNEQKLVILAEEFGEVARALTYDESDTDNLKKELVQVATMALMWRQSLEGPAQGEPVTN